MTQEELTYTDDNYEYVPKEEYHDPKESSLYKHANRELEFAGYFDGDEMNKMMANHVLELVKVFATQGHSGLSAPFCIDLFSTLAKYEPLRPLQGTDDEWNQISDTCWQNNRCSQIFKELMPDGSYECYNIEGRVFRDKNGCCYTNVNSRTPVEFPYLLEKPEIVDVAE